MSALASNWERLGKPFNPLLGETYELERPEFRAVCEQVRIYHSLCESETERLSLTPHQPTSGRDSRAVCEQVRGSDSAREKEIEIPGCSQYN